MFIDWIWTVIASSAGTALLLAVVGYLGRAHIAHWLTRDLEAVKAKHQRDLEAYKVSLIADTERVKAVQDVRKAAAVKILEKRFATLDNYHRAFLNVKNELCALANAPAAFKTLDRCQKAHDRMTALADAEHALDIFLDAAGQQLILNFRGHLLQHALGHCNINSAPANLAPQFIATANQLHTQVEALIKGEIDAMQNLA